MKLSLPLLVFTAALRPGVSAAAARHVEKCCSDDTCVAAVKAHRVPLYGDHEQTQACMSFLAKTVTPVPTTKIVMVYKTHSTTRTLTKPVTVLTTFVPTQTSFTTQIMLNTETDRETDIETDKLTYYTSDTVDVTYTVTNTATVTITSTIETAAASVTGTTTAIASDAQQQQNYEERKRDINGNNENNKGECFSCPAPAPYKNSAVPTWAAAACNSEASRYSSACSCAGFTHGTTTTLPRCTATRSKTSTLTTTHTITHKGPSTTQTVTKPTTTVGHTVTTTNIVYVTATDYFTVTESTTIDSPITNSHEVDITVTATDVVTVTPSPSPDQSCRNAGLAYAILTDPFVNDTFDPADPYPAFDIDYIKNEEPDFIGTTDRLGITQTDYYAVPVSIYPDAPKRVLAYTAVNHQGFIYAPTTGVYTVSVPTSDDITFVWIGNAALEDYERDNALITQPYVSGGGIPKIAMIPLIGGSYNPFRVLFGNGQLDYAFGITVTGPDGDTILSATGSNAQYLVQFACDGSTPNFAPWGTNPNSMPIPTD